MLSFIFVVVSGFAFSQSIDISNYYDTICDCYKDLPYGPEQEWHLLDFYKANTDERTTIVIFAHGAGSNKDVIRLHPFIKAYVLDSCLDNDISVASVEFRHPVEDTSLSAPATDIARVVQFFRYYHEDLNIDTMNVFLAGTSRGTLAIWTAVQDDLADPVNDDPILRKSSRVNGVWAVQGQTSYNSEWIVETFFHPAIWQFFQPYYNLGHAIGDVTPDDPPMILNYKDSLVPLPVMDTNVDLIHLPNFGYVFEEEYIVDGIGDRVEVNYNIIDTMLYYGFIDFVRANSYPETIENISAAKNILLYPNPADENVYIKTQDVMIEKVKILDINGRVLKEIFADRTGLVIDISYLPPGLYILKILAKDSFYCRKLLVN